ncbi:allophanate hydrolase [Halalkalibacter akibai]|uniref:Allophanate hydrolase n=1 Tax=Halalkalibacter akibai (strain ATCC 43226 / DSM 21942 / CIP 109018 / JCM 9157 / 1139) TaxID=1236973 RepID=W4QX72_HALA3|nr:allophanate hydrolase [Halalkalibacter akibai]GAE36735.1 allophanate hydrolase [Halalkalibacter akibai JCM 9157]
MSKVTIPEKLTVDWLKERYKANELTPEDVVSEIIKRSNADQEMNIWITPPSMEIIKPYLDGLRALDKESAPLWGIPFAIKDNIDLADVPTTAGCPEYAYTPKEHAIVVSRLIEAGAVPVGKANLDQFATGLVGTRSPYGETHNSFRPELISGGSSAGSAVSVARGQAAFSLGTDTAGSGRIPALLNNLVGYKPSLGSWSTKGVVPACASLDCVTVFAHSLKEALLVDDSVRGIEESDPWSRYFPQPVSVVPDKFLIPSNPLDFYGPYAKEYSEAWDKAVDKLKTLNVPIEYVDTKFLSDAAAILYDGPMVAERWAAVGEFIEKNPGVAFPVTEKVIRSGSAEQYDATSVFKAIHKLQAYKLETKKLFENAVLVMPTAGGTWTRNEVRENPIATNSAMGLYTNHCNLLDLCAVAIPAGEAASKLPFGITLFGLAKEEGLIRGAASLYESTSEKTNQTFDEPTTLVAVCGLHMRGFPLEKQMNECRARFVKEAKTAPKYQMVKLPSTPAKPGLIKNEQIAGSIELEIWEMPLVEFGKFTASIPAPLGIGKVELEDGSEVSGFICESHAVYTAEDITASGGWRHVLQVN